MLYLLGTGRVRKNTRRWCRGRIGLEHVPYDEKLWEVARQDVIQWRVRCKGCGRVLDWKSTDLNGQPKLPPKCQKCGRESKTLHAITKICRRGTGCALDEFYDTQTSTYRERNIGRIGGIGRPTRFKIER